MTSSKGLYLESVAAIGALGFASGNPARAGRPSLATNSLPKDTIMHRFTGKPGKLLPGRACRRAWTIVDVRQNYHISTEPHRLYPPTLRNVDRRLNGGRPFVEALQQATIGRAIIVFVYGLELDIGGFSR